MHRSICKMRITKFIELLKSGLTIWNTSLHSFNIWFLYLCYLMDSQSLDGVNLYRAINKNNLLVIDVLLFIMIIMPFWHLRLYLSPIKCYRQLLFLWISCCLIAKNLSVIIASHTKELTNLLNTLIASVLEENKS